MKEIDVITLKTWKDQGKDFQLIDCREDFEYEMGNIGGLHIPLNQIVEHENQVARDKDVVIHCRSGKRSGMAVRELESRFGLSNLYNLSGGILAWKEQIDPSVQAE
jgi:rhodanese-related sulfurtransferase